MKRRNSARALRRPRRKFLLPILVITLAVVIPGDGTHATFAGSTRNSTNRMATGAVVLSDNDAGGSVISLANAKPGNSDTGCISVTMTGSLSSTVRSYATVTGSLAQYLDLTVTRGTDSSPSFRSCVGFLADSTNYVGAGAGVIYQGTLSAYPATYSAGIVDPISSSPETWTTSETHAYEFRITLTNNPAAQALTSSATFYWEARNL